MEFTDNTMERRACNTWENAKVMSAGTKLLVKIFEAFTTHNTPQKIIRRLFCESGQAAVKAYRYANNNTKQNLDEIIETWA